MRQDDELWMKRLKEQLEDYSEPVPWNGWERLEKDLHSTRERKVVPYNRWWAVAAAALILVVSGVSFYFLHTPVAQDIRLVKVPVPVYIPDTLPVVPQKETVSNYVEPAKPFRTDASEHIANAKVKHIKQEDKNETDTKVTAKEVLDDTWKTTDEVIVPVVEEVDKEPAKKEEPERRMAKPSGKDKLHLPVENKKKTSANNNWVMGLSVNSGATSSFSNSGGDADYVSSNAVSLDDFANVGNSSTGFIKLPNKYLVLNKDGVPQMIEGASYDHQLPVTVGISVRKGLGNGFSVETGLTYTFLKSDIYQPIPEKIKIGQQKLHYIGIPIRANWDFVDTNNFTFYLSGGGMVEKCVYGKTLNEKNTVNPLLFSLAGGIGAQYKVSKQFGIYIEPGVSYFFDDGSKTETIRKENPFNFNFQAGVRFTY